MTDKCPNDDCRDEIHSRINERVTKKDLFQVLGVFLVVLGIFLGLVVNSYSDGAKVRDEALKANVDLDKKQEEKINACDKNQASMNVELGHIKERLTNIETGNAAILYEIRKMNANGK